MKIGIDMDGVIIDTINFISREFTETFGSKVTPGDIVYGLNRLEGADRMFEEKGEYLLCSLDPMEHAVEAINSLGARHEIHIVSARFRMHYDATLEWIRKHGIKADEIIFTEGGGKADICIRNGIDLLIEDSLSNALEVSAAGIPVILLSTEYNRAEVPDNISYCDSWSDILPYLELFSKEEAAG